MTVSYQYDVASSTSGGFTRLLFKWKGSVYKLVWRELLWFTFAYTLLSVLYRTVLTDDQKKVFERVVDYFNTFLGLIPLSFVLGVYVTLVVTRWWQQFLAIPWPDKDFEKLVLYCDTVINFIPLTFINGFYVSFVAARWWQQYMAIPWPDKLAHCIALYVTGNDEHSRMMRRTLARYLNLSLILVLRSISMAVKKRFPTLQHLVEGGFMTKVELDIYQSVPSSEFNTYWIPCTWLISLIKDAKKDKMIPDSQGLKLLVEEFNEFRSKCGLLWSYDWVSIPLVYTQVVTLATYSFFGACVIGRQYVDGITMDAKLRHIDLYIPIFTFLQFFFYMGLLKVAEALINPFGDDDEDFELNWMIDRHLKVSYLVVDTLMSRTPPLVKDAHFDETEPTLAYTKAAMIYKKKTFRGSVAAVLYDHLIGFLSVASPACKSNPTFWDARTENGRLMTNSLKLCGEKKNNFYTVPEDEQAMVLPEIAEEEEENGEHNSDLSINKHSNSIMNLLTWTSSHATRQHLHPGKKAMHDEIRAQRSYSVSDDVIAMEAGQMPLTSPRTVAFGGSHPAEIFAATHPEESFLDSRQALTSSTSGIRGKYSPTLVGSSESLPSRKILMPATPPVASCRVVARGDSLPEKPDIPDDSIERKSKSIDMGQITVTELDETAGHRNKTRSCIPRLRDLKRKHKKPRQSPTQGRHKLWQSKESIPKSQVDEGPPMKLGDSAPTIPIVPSRSGIISLSLPSLHLAGRKNSAGSETAAAYRESARDADVEAGVHHQWPSPETEPSPPPIPARPQRHHVPEFSDTTHGCSTNGGSRSPPRGKLKGKPRDIQEHLV